MTVFIIAQKYSRILGIVKVEVPNFLQGFPAHSCYRTFVLSSFIINLIAPSLFVILGTATFDVFAEVLTIVVGVFIATASYIVLLLDENGIYELLDSIDLMIERSKHFHVPKSNGVESVRV